MNRIKRIGGEEGSVLFWVVGCTVLVLLGFETAAAVSSLTGEQRRLQSAADRAVLAALNEVDTTLFQISGEVTDLTINRGQARLAVSKVLFDLFDQYELDFLQVSDGEVSLALSCDWQAPFGLGPKRLSALSGARIVPRT